MKVGDYHYRVQQPAYVATEAMRRAGMPVSLERATAQADAWQKELLELEKYVEGEARKGGFSLKYSPAHAALPDATLRDFLYKGLGLETDRKSEKTGKLSTDDLALLPYAAVGVNHNKMNGEPFEDHPVVYAILKIRSVAKARGTHLGGLVRWRQSDGCCHPKYNWNQPNTTRLSAEDPPVQQLPERADPEVAKLVKRCIVPRVSPWLGNPDDWDPRKHGWIGKVDVKGAEMVIRAGCFARCDVLGPYLRMGKDTHGKTASVFYKVPEGAFKKSSNERNVVGKSSNFLLIFGGGWKALQLTLWKDGRYQVEDETVKGWHEDFFAAYPRLKKQYMKDTWLALTRGYIEDAYGRRWSMPVPEGVRLRRPKTVFGEDINFDTDLEIPRGAWGPFQHVQHCYANRPTQSTQGTTTLWCLALCYHGEYVDLQVPSCWATHGVPFPEAAGWQLNEGEGPGGKPLRAWIFNTVHDSVWEDGAPGTLEAAMKVTFRRFMGIPADFLLEADQPWRVEAEVGPDLGHLQGYNEVAKKFGLEAMPVW